VLVILSKLGFFLVFYSIIFTSLQSQELIHLDRTDKEYNPSRFIYYFEDKTNSLKLEDILILPISDFKKIETETISLGFSSSTYWLSFDLQNLTREKKWFLEIGFPLLYKIEFYNLQYEVLKQKKFLGLYQNFDQREFKHRKFIVPFHVDENYKSRILLKIESITSLRVPLKLISYEAFVRYDFFETVLISSIQSIFMLLFIYHLLTYFILKSKNYLLLCLVVLAFQFFHLSQTGLLFQYLIPNHSNLALKLNLFFATCCLFFFVLYVYFYIEISKYLKKSAYIFKVFFLIVLVIALFSLLSIDYYKYIAKFIQIIAPLFIIYTIIITVLLGFKTNHISKYFLLALIIFSTTLIIYIFRNLNILPVNHFTNYSVPVGGFIFMLLTSLGLTNKIKELTKENLESEEVNRSKTIFFASLSHDIRTPMNALKGIIELLDNSPLNKEQREYISILSNKAVYLNQLLDQILDYSKLDSNKMQIQLGFFDLNTLLKELSIFYRELANNKGIKLELEIDSKIESKILFDSLKLKQILNNLVSNAIKFTEKGNVVIRAELVSKESESSEQVILFTIQDSGIGIHPDKIKYLFQPFSQLNTSESSKYGGTGLGLALSNKLLNLFHSEISISSEEGVGTKFFFKIQTKYTSRVENQSEATRTHSIFTKKELKILIIEDDSIMQLITKRKLEQNGFTVDFVSNGQDAILKLESEFYPIILVDMFMPILDGFQTIKKIREIEKEKTKIFIYSSLPSEQENFKLNDLDCNGILKKPIDLEEFNRLLQKEFPNLKE
jgi:signal transduction histidine kinase/CheY-like chemotaxis protein